MNDENSEFHSPFTIHYFQRRRKMIKKILLAVIVVLVLAAIGFVLWVTSYPELSEIKTAGGLAMTCERLFIDVCIFLQRLCMG